MIYQLAEVNIARMLAPLDSPLLAEFVAQLDAINALADTSPGFLWRLQTLEGNATALRPYEDDLILVNLSLWATLADLSAFVYKSRHRQVLQQRQEWFERFNGPYLALWWVPSGHIPTVEEAKERQYYRFETLLRRPYGKMLVWKAKTSLYRGTSLRLKA